MKAPLPSRFAGHGLSALLSPDADLPSALRLSGEAFRLGRAAGHADAELFQSCQRLQLAFERGGLDRWERPLRVALGRWFVPQSFLRWTERTPERYVVKAPLAPALLMTSSAEDCRWAFYDESRNRSATWCDMKVCGNRAKVRGFRERTRSEAASEAGEAGPI